MKYKPEIAHIPEPIVVIVDQSVSTTEVISISQTVLLLHKVDGYWENQSLNLIMCFY